MFYLKKPNSEKETSINLLYYLKDEKKNFKYSTGLMIHPKDWDSKRKSVKKKLGNSMTLKFKLILKRLNQLEVTFIDLVAEFQLNDKPLNPKELRHELDVRFKGKDKERLTLFEAYGKMLRQMVAGGKAKGTVKQYKKVMNNLKAYQEYTGNLVSFDRINNDFYFNYLEYARNERDCHDNTIGRDMGRFKTFMRWAKEEGYHDNTKFLKFAEMKYETDDIALSKEEVNRIEEVELVGHLDRVRDLFLIGIYSGQRFSDYSVFEKADIKDGMIIKRSKKMHENSYIPIHSRLRAILEKYDYELPLISNQKFNAYIKVVCERAGINDEIKKIMRKGSEKVVTYHMKYERISSHTARRTFITQSLKSGMQPKIVMKITGIRDLKTLNNYNKVDEEDIMKSMMETWDSE